MRVLFLAATLALSALAPSVNADCSKVKATLGHTSCKALEEVCKADGGLAFAHTTSVDGGDFKCKSCPAMNVQGGGDGVDVGKGFKILKGVGLHYTLACVGVIAVLYALAMCMEKHDADDAASRGTHAAEGLGLCGRACRPVEILRNTFSDRTRCITRLRPGSSFLLNVLRFLDRDHLRDTLEELVIGNPRKLGIHIFPEYPPDN